MTEEDFQHRLKELYQPPKNEFTYVHVPKMKYMVIDGQGDPGQNGMDAAIKWLYSIAHFLIPLAKERMGKNFVYPPVECLFWADSESDFIVANKAKWLWRAMIVLADWMTQERVNDAIVQAEEKLGAQPPESLRVEYLEEGQSVQIMHVGDYSEIGVLCEKLYKEFLPDNNLVPNGAYHEIYLSDPNRTAPEKRRVVIRQPVNPA